MDVHDHSRHITVGAIEVVAQEILQCGTRQLEQLIAKGTDLDLEPIKAEFNDKMYLVLLHRTYSRRAESQARLLLVAFFDDTLPPETSTSTTKASPDASLGMVVLKHAGQEKGSQ